MNKFAKTIEANLEIPELKAMVNRRLPIGYSVAVSTDERGLVMEVYDGDVLIMSVPIDGLSQEEAMNKILKNFGDTDGN